MKHKAHHAMVYIADSLDESTVPEEQKQQSADVQHFVQDRFSIDDVRTLTLQAAQTAIGSGGRSFVIVTKNILPEAQNALLKLFEDPPTGVTFHLVLPQESIMLPTLRSRVLVQQDRELDGDWNDVFKNFLAASYKDRIAIAEDLTKKKEVGQIEQIISGALAYASSRVSDNATCAEVVLFVEGYSKAAGASKRMLLEELALSLPQS